MNKLTRREFIARTGMAAAGLALAPYAFADDGKRLNVLFITADDLNYDSLGVTGCKVPDITPNLDKLASQGMRFEEAHLGIAVCQPSRSVWMTGRYPHRNGAMGFEPIKTDVPTLQESLHAAGYFNGIFAKIPHLAPESKFCWDVKVGAEELGQGKDPALYYAKMKAFLDQAKASGKPWFLMANCQDPHRPFPGSEGEKAREAGGAKRKSPVDFPDASRYYKPEEITIPGFLPDLPDIRTELAQYFTAVHRCDETVGNILKALKEAGLEDDTIVIFMSDNGISMPFSKANCYRTSTRTPLMVRWPGKIKPGSVNRDDLVSGADFTPTVLDALGLKQIEGMDGRSYLPLLKDKKQDGREKVFTFFNETSAKNEYPMRCVRTKKYSYIFNSWSDGKTMYQAEGMSGLTFKAMQTAAGTDPKIAERVKFLRYRASEEFYDLEADPNETRNLIADPKFKDTIEKMRAELLQMMERTKDPLLDKFKARVSGK
jgi:N-sulfoglucosamine sulfohydrolase